MVKAKIDNTVFTVNDIERFLNEEFDLRCRNKVAD